MRLLAAFVVPAVLAVALYFMVFRGPVSTSTGDWGTFGDYVGGVAGTLIALGAFVALLETLRLQSASLQQQRRDIDRANSLAYVTALIQALSQHVSLYEGSRQLAATTVARLLDQSPQSEAEKAVLDKMIGSISSQIEQYGVILKLLQDDIAFLVSADPSVDEAKMRASATLQRAAELDPRRKG
jgi:hypothetical protein